MAAIGFGLFYKYYTAHVSYATQEGLLVIASIGIGLSLQSPMLILQAAMPLKDMAATTGAFSLTRSMGGSIGMSIVFFSGLLGNWYGGAILNIFPRPGCFHCSLEYKSPYSLRKDSRLWN